MSQNDALPECLREKSVEDHPTHELRIPSVGIPVSSLDYEEEHDGFLKKLAEIRREELHCDIILIAKNRDDNSHLRIPAHKIVLMATSSYFSCMFRLPMKEASAAEVKLKDIDAECLLLLVEFMYTGCVTVTEDNVQYLLATASILQLNGVKEACSKFLINQININNCIGISLFAQLHSCFTLLTASKTFVAQYFEFLIKSEEFLSLSYDDLHPLIYDDQLGVRKEEIVFLAVKNWIDHDFDLRIKYAADLLPAVRFPLMKPEFIFSIVQNWEGINKDVKCKDILLDGCRTIIMGKEADRYYPETKHKWRSKRVPPLSKEIIMLFGGQDPRAIKDVDIFEADSCTWSNSKPLISCNCRGASAHDMVREKIYLVGGFNGTNRLRTVNIYDPYKDRWVPGPAMHDARETLGAAWSSDHGCIFAVGGFDGHLGLNSIEQLDSRTGQWALLPSMTTRRSSVCTTIMNNQLYVIGGYDGTSRMCLDTTEIFDIRTNRWLVGPTMHEIRSGASVVTYDNRFILVAGGHDGPTVKNSVELLKDDQWHDFCSLNESRRNATMAIANGTVHIIGGDNGTENLRTVEVLKGLDGMWETLETKLTRGRSYACSAVMTKNYTGEWRGLFRQTLYEKVPNMSQQSDAAPEVEILHRQVQADEW